MNPFTAHVEVSSHHKMAVMLKEERVVFVCRKCSVAGCSGCTIITEGANLHAAHRPRGGAPGGTAMPPLLHR